MRLQQEVAVLTRAPFLSTVGFRIIAGYFIIVHQDLGWRAIPPTSFGHHRFPFTIRRTPHTHTRARARRCLLADAWHSSVSETDCWQYLTSCCAIWIPLTRYQSYIYKVTNDIYNLQLNKYNLGKKTKQLRNESKWRTVAQKQAWGKSGYSFMLALPSAKVTDAKTESIDRFCIKTYTHTYCSSSPAWPLQQQSPQSKAVKMLAYTYTYTYINSVAILILTCTTAATNDYFDSQYS